MTFAANFTDMMVDDLLCQPGTVDATGKFTAVGSPLTVKCRVSGKIKLVRDRTGQQVVSSIQAVTNSFNNLTTDKHRYTLPVRFDPRLSLKAIAVVKVSDENGPCFERVMFP